MYDDPCLEVRWFIRLTRFSGRGAGAMASCSIDALTSRLAMAVRENETGAAPV